VTRKAVTQLQAQIAELEAAKGLRRPSIDD
jgi:hypothetical protein